MDWKRTEKKWLLFLESVRSARVKIGATYAGAWFRGQTNSWDLNPGILRELNKLNEYVANLKLERKRQKKHLNGRKRHAKKNNVDSDQMVFEETEKLRRLDTQIEKYQHKILDQHHLHGEGRAYVEYRFRSGTHQESSWKTLAEMQHYGIPTRLLDWTESFGIALAFALEDYIKVLDEIWKEERNDWKKKPQEIELSFQDAAINKNLSKSQPTLWIMNPYRMAHEAVGESVLWDYTLLPDDDYFAAFINNGDNNNPKFSRPIPILSPWKDERIAAQEGVFTFHGRASKPLNKITTVRVF